MSTIKSSAENLTLNADGANNDVIIQSNGSTKVTVDGATGNVGVGAATPLAPVVAKTTVTASSDKIVYGMTQSDNNAGRIVGMGIAATGSVANQGINFYTCLSSVQSERLRINEQGNVGIGTTSPSQLLELSGATAPVIRLTDTTYDQYAEISTANAGSLILKADVGNGGTGSTYIGFEVDATERMRIGATGNVLVGATSVNAGVAKTPLGLYVEKTSTLSNSVVTFADTDSSPAGNVTLELSTPNDTTWTTKYEILFTNINGNYGSISSTGSAVAYNTSSDYRLKENVDYDWDATTRLKQLKPARFNFIADDTNTLVDGFIAHEVSSVIPEAITGTKDAMTAEVLYVEGDELPEGKVVGDVKTASAPDMQGIDQSKLVPLLVKTIQELEARITALEA